MASKVYVIDAPNEVQPIAPAAMADMTPSAQPETCRICKQLGGSDMIAPCTCRGAKQHVHRRCLDQFRAVTSDTAAFTHCSQCGFEYWMQIRPDRKRGMRKLKFRALVVSHTMLIFLIVQSVICALGYAVHVLDSRNEKCTKYVICSAADDCADEATRGLDTCTSPSDNTLDDCPANAICRKMGPLRYKVYYSIADHARQLFAEHYFRSNALHCTATARILIPAECSAVS